MFCPLKTGKYPKGKINKSLFYITYIVMLIAMFFMEILPKYFCVHFSLTMEIHALTDAMKHLQM